MTTSFPAVRGREKAKSEMYVPYNPNPSGRDGIDCTVRALTKALDIPWEKAYTMLAVNGFILNDVMNATHVFGETLKQNGFTRHVIPDTCPACYTEADFAADHPEGTYVLAFGDHVCTIISGNWYDSWDSGWRVPILYWTKEETETTETTEKRKDE